MRARARRSSTIADNHRARCGYIEAHQVYHRIAPGVSASTAQRRFAPLVALLADTPSAL